MLCVSITLVRESEYYLGEAGAGLRQPGLASDEPIVLTVAAVGPTRVSSGLSVAIVETALCVSGLCARTRVNELRRQAS